MWSSPDVVGLFSINVVSFSRNVVLSDPLFSLNSVSKLRILSVRTVYVLNSLQVVPTFTVMFSVTGPAGTDRAFVPPAPTTSGAAGARRHPASGWRELSIKLRYVAKECQHDNVGFTFP